MNPPPCSCGWPEPLRDSPYRGEQIAEVDGLPLLQLTEHEVRHAGAQFFCLRGATHWVQPHHFAEFAAKERKKADRLDQAGSLVARHVGSLSRPGVPE